VEPPLSLGRSSSNLRPARAYRNSWPLVLTCRGILAGGRPRNAVDEKKQLRVLITSERRERRESVVRAVSALNHTIIAADTELAGVGPVTRSERPDVALVIVGENSASALKSIDKIVREAACPVIALFDVSDRAFVDEAAKLGIFAYITAEDLDELQSAIDIALRRFAEYHALEGAFGRRAVTERAKGILMERHHVNEQEAFSMLRAHARETNRKVVDVAEALVSSHSLLPDSSRTEGT
jgi:AmiR/NasT family two-component response regulator